MSMIRAFQELVENLIRLIQATASARATARVREVLTSAEYAERWRHLRYLSRIEREREIGLAYVEAEAKRIREELGL